MKKRRKITIGLLVFALCLGVVVTRAFFEGKSALFRGDEAQESGDTEEAIRWWRRAARWYVPGAPHVSAAYQRLSTLATEAEEKGDRQTALAAWRGVRSSILSTRSFYTPFEDHLEPANRHIADLMAAAEGPQADPEKTEAERAQWHYQLLARDEAPSVAWSVIAILGFLLWIGGGITFALRGVTEDDKLAPRPAAYAGAMIALGLLTWLLALSRA